VRGRQVCWSDPELQKLATRFVPAADEVWRLHNRKDLDCLFFQGFCEEGHYGGRSHPTTTRQGIYCCTPSGRFLASVNTTDPRRMQKMLEQALERWEAMPVSERLLDYDPATRREEIRRASRLHPADGLALRVYSRDLPRTDLPDDWRRSAWNVDSLWFRKEEVRALLPESLAQGEGRDWPKPLVQRLVGRNLVDNVRGQTNGYRPEQIQVATLRTTIVEATPTTLVLRLEGESRATTTGAWPTKGRIESLEKRAQNSRGLQTKMAGEAVYDRTSGRFTKFRLAAVGTRWGRTQYNFRQDDLDESPIGFAIVLDPEDPGTRVAPAELGAYGW
jgi:hypothetical protein